MRILIADDMPGLRMLARVTLSGHDIMEAESGDEAIRLVREHSPDLVVLDVNMPGLSGLQVCKAIRENCALASTYVVVMTASSAEDAERAYDAGADAFLGKPFSPVRLTEIVHELAGRRRP